MKFRDVPVGARFWWWVQPKIKVSETEYAECFPLKWGDDIYKDDDEVTLTEPSREHLKERRARGEGGSLDALRKAVEESGMRWCEAHREAFYPDAPCSGCEEDREEAAKRERASKVEGALEGLLNAVLNAPGVPPEPVQEALRKASEALGPKGKA